MNDGAHIANSAKIARTTLGFAAVIALGLNTIVGSGIFRLPSDLVRELGAVSPLAFFAGAALLLPIGLSYARAARALPRDGSAYAYATRAFGPRFGAFVGFTIYVATLTTLASAAVAIPGQLVAAPSPRLEAWGGASVVVTLLLLTAIGLRRAGAAGALIATIKVAALILFALVGLASAPHDATAAALLTGSAHPASGHGNALLLVVFALSGFETAAVPGGSAEHAQSRIPRAVLGSLGAATLAYALVQLAVVRVLPGAADSQRPIADAAGVLFGKTGTMLVGALGAVSLVGLAHAMAITAPIVLRALVATWSEGSARRTVERRAMAISAALGVALALSLDFRALVDFTSVLVMTQYAVTALAAPILAGRSLRRPRTWPLPALSIAACAFVVSHAAPKEIAVAIASALPGAFFAFRARRGLD